MAYDGLVVSATVKEFRERLIGGRIAKITQPEKDEIQLTVRNQKDNVKVQISVNPSLPLCTLTEDAKPAPINAPTFCMALRKHIGNGAILDVRQPDQALHEDGLERVILFTIEHLDEMGDLGKRYLAVELMGKYSNIILLRDDHSIIDSVKRISASQSSVREVLPNRPYFIPDAGGKKNPLALDEAAFCALLAQQPEPVFKALFHHITGLSPLTASELCHRAGVDPDLSANCQPAEALAALYGSFHHIIEEVAIKRQPDPVIVYQDEVPTDFSAFDLTLYEEDAAFEVEHFDSMSEVIRRFYSEKDKSSRIRQRSTDLRKVLTTLMERAGKKLMIQEKQLRDTEGMDKYRVYGELLHTYGYSVPAGAKSTVVTNYYDNTELTIPLDETLSATDNAKRYFEKYNKQKRTYEALTTQIEETQSEIEHLQSIAAALSMPLEQEDLTEIRQEMVQYGYLKKAPVSGKKGKIKITSKPHHYISSDGFHMYVGKNNFQNDALTFHFAENNDMWFHAKKRPGSHVIVRTEGKELPDRTYEEAGQLAAYYSSGRDADKVEIDYVEKKQVKKPAGGKPGFVIYHTNYSLMAKPDISGLKEIL